MAINFTNLLHPSLNYLLRLICNVLNLNQIFAVLTIILLMVNAPTLLGSHQANVFADSIPTGPPSPDHLIQYHSKDTAGLSKMKQDMASGKALQTSNGPLATLSSNQLASSGTGFAGLDMTQSGGWYPPDVQVAAGPNHIVEMVNLEVSITDKSGTMASSYPKSLASFFGKPSSDFLSDPRVVYDSLSSKWFATLSDITTGEVLLAVSSSDDPTSSWSVHPISFGDNNNYCPDQPILGLNADKVVISTNEFSNKCGINGGGSFYVGAQYAVIDKTNLINNPGSPAVTVSFGPFSSLFSVHPAQSLSSSSSLYMVSVGSGGTSTLNFFTITGNPSTSNTVMTQNNIAITSVGVPPDAKQLGTSNLVATGDARVQDAKWFNNVLWTTFGDSCVPSGDTVQRACVHLIQLDTSSSPPSKPQDFLYAINGNYLFYPALAIDGSKNLDVVYGISSSGSYPSIAATAQTFGSTAMQQQVMLKSGTNYEGTTRYGDYFGAGVDPSSTNQVWVAGEYHTSLLSSSYWSTWIRPVDASLNSDNTNTVVTAVSPPATITPGTVLTLTATVSDTTTPSSTPTGTVSWSAGAAGGSFGSSTCLPGAGNTLVCTVTYTASASGTISATYGGDSTHASSTGTYPITVTKYSTSSSITGPTLVTHKTSNNHYTITVSDTTAPSGKVNWSVSGGGTISSSCTLSPASSSSTCTVTFKAPPTARTVIITASYVGDSTHNTSTTTKSVTIN